MAGIVKQQEQRAAQIAQLLNGLVAMLEPAQTLDYGVLVREGLLQLLDASCLLPLLESYLRSDSVLDMVKERTAYHAVLSVVLALAKNPLLVGLLEGTRDVAGEEKPARVEELLMNLKAATTVVLQQKGKLASVDVEHEESTALAQEISSTAMQVQTLLQAHRAAKQPSPASPAPAIVKQPSSPPSVRAGSGSELEAQYKGTLKPLQFAEFGMRDTRGDYIHHYRQRIATEKIVMGPKMKRLIQEVSALATGLPLSLSSSVFLRVDSERIDVMKALIIGPAETPYQNGCFQFDIYCPQEYPNGPPVVNLETTGGGTVRFNPNLYADGKVCLSLLGTWSGGENEKWNAKTSTLLQVLVSIQSLILVEQPYFNEPGYEREMNTPTGQTNSANYNENIRTMAMRYAVLEQLRRPSPGFEDVIRSHFRVKRAELLNQCRSWLSQAQNSRDQMRQMVEDVRAELQKLDPSTPLQDPPPEPDKKQKEREEKEAIRVTAALDIQENLAPQFPLGLILRALEQQNDNTEAAVNWLFEQGEAELLKNPKLANPTEFQF
jgi:baculoviral IAP repeat-containing protein 6 (apollon)